MFLRILFTWFISFSLSVLLVAQDTESSIKQDTLISQILSEVVVSANRYNSIRINTPEAIKVLSDKTIQQYQLRNAPEALFYTPGVFVQKTNHGGGSPFIRGLTGNQTLLLIDGIRLSNATARYGPNQYFNTIDVFSIEKMEVMRGTGSVQYGSDALGGTIQSFSHELFASEKPGWGSTLVSRIVTQGMEQSMHTSANYSSRNMAFRAGLTLRNFGDLVGGDTTGRQSPNGYKEHNYYLKGKIFLSNQTTITISYQSVHQIDIPIYHKIALEDYAINKFDPQKRKLAYLRVNREFNEGLFKSAVITIASQHTEEGRESLKNGSSILRSENDKVQSLTFSAEAYATNGNVWSANSGLEVYNDHVNSSRFDTDLSNAVILTKRGLYPDGASLASIAFFTIHTFDLPEWKFTAGARLNTFIIKVKDDVIGSTKLTPSAVVGNIAILRKLNAKSNLFLSLNSGFRAPNIDDLGTLGIVDFRYETSNFSLKPEHSFQYQIGYKYHDRKLRGEFYLFRNELYNLIVRNKMEGDSIDGYQVYQKENAERAYIQGIETVWDFSFNSALSFYGSITYTYGWNISKGEHVRRIPPLFGRLAAEYKLKNWWINLEWQAAGKQNRLAQGDKDDNRIPVGGTPAWNIINIHSGYTIRFFTIDLSLQNLLNKDYRIHGSGVNGYGRSVFLSLAVNF